MEKHSEPNVNADQWPEVVDDYSHLPQHYQRNNIPPEAVKHQSYTQVVPQPSTHTYNALHSTNGQKEKRICGLTVFQFIILILLSISVVSGAILGGIFGSGVLNRRNKSYSSDSSSSDSSGSSIDTSSLLGTSSPTRTVTQGATSTGDSSSATGTGISADYCNNGTTYTTSSSATFLIMCAIDWPDNSIRPGTWTHDLKYLDNQPTMEECLQTCATWPSGGVGSQVCRAVVWNYKQVCYLKNQTAAKADTFYDYDFKYIQAGVLL